MIAAVPPVYKYIFLLSSVEKSPVFRSYFCDLLRMFVIFVTSSVIFKFNLRLTMQRHLTAVLCQVESTWRAGHQLTRTWRLVRAISCPAATRNQSSEMIKALVFFLKVTNFARISLVFLLKKCLYFARIFTKFRRYEESSTLTQLPE